MRKVIFRFAVIGACSFALLAALATPAMAQLAVESEPATTTLSISAPAVIAARASAKIVMTLEDTSGVPVAGAQVTLFRLTATTETTISSGTTGADGRFSATVSPKSRIIVRARFRGTSAYRASISRKVAIMPKAALSKPWTHDSFATPGQWLPARGTLWPSHPSSTTSTKILCERLESGKWVRRRTYSAPVVTSAGVSRYSGKFALPQTGTWRVRIKHSDGSHATSLSTATRINVTRWRDRYVGQKLGGFAPKDKMVAITIDDGPNQRTIEICEILERYGAKGTFFFTNTLLKRYMWQARVAYGRGHEIANHTATHSPLTGSYAHSLREATLARDRIKRATGFAPIWIRGMGGGIDKTGLRAVVGTHQLYINWSVDSLDSHAQYTDPDILYRNVINTTHSGDVVLIHQTHAETVKALPRILKELKRRGYKLVTLSELAAKSSRP